MRRLPLLVIPVSALLLVACGGDQRLPNEAVGTDRPSETSSYPPALVDEPNLSAGLVGADGTELGSVEVTDGPDGTEISVEVSEMPPGFHGFHVHAIGECEPDSPSPVDPTLIGDFLSAGGHLGAGETAHGAHTGDLPSLFVLPDGTGSLMAMTQNFTSEDLLDDDGSAFMVHEGADNFANIPTRYAPDGPDQVTLDTGDSGARIACGVAAE